MSLSYPSKKNRSPGSTNVTDLIFPGSVPIWDAWNAPLPNPKLMLTDLDYLFGWWETTVEKQQQKSETIGRH